MTDEAPPIEDGLVERLVANGDPRCYQHNRALSLEAADTITRLVRELGEAREAFMPVLRFHETGGHEGDGSMEAIERALAALPAKGDEK